MVSDRVAREDAPRVREEIARGRLLDGLIGRLWKLAEDLAREAGGTKKRDRATRRGGGHARRRDPEGLLGGADGGARPAGRRNENPGRRARLRRQDGGRSYVRAAPARRGSERATRSQRTAHERHPLRRGRGQLHAVVRRGCGGRPGLPRRRCARYRLRLHTGRGEAALPHGGQEPVLRGGVGIAGAPFRDPDLVKHDPAAGQRGRRGHGGVGA